MEKIFLNNNFMKHSKYFFLRFFSPYFLIDPRDGSLYIFTGGSENENRDGGLKKFPYTIAELVSASPSKSSDGFLYTGDKKDQWLAIDYRTGAKLDTLTAETLSSKISIADDNVIFIGRTQYTITIFELATRRKIFNMTYFDYSTHAHASKQPQSQTRPFTANEKDDLSMRGVYPYYHFTSSSDGTIVTLDRKTGILSTFLYVGAWGLYTRISKVFNVYTWLVWPISQYS